MESYVTFDIFVGERRRTGRALRLRKEKEATEISSDDWETVTPWYAYPIDLL